MSTLVSCQELRFVGGQRYNGPCSSSPLADRGVDVSTETLLSLWDTSARDTAPCQQHETPLRELQYGDHAVPPHHTWPDLLSPHLQRNKQLQDTLLQREEELARLHEENTKLREFLNSSYVKSLEAEHQKLLSSPSVRHRKRRGLSGVEGHVFAGRGQEGQVSKRTCRNLSLEFCSVEELEATPPVESWVLETLGLKDQDTIDPDASFTLEPHVHFNNPPPLSNQPGYSPVSRRPATAITSAPRYPSPSTGTAPDYASQFPAYSPPLASTCDLSAIMPSPSNSYEPSADSFCSSGGVDVTPSCPPRQTGCSRLLSPSPCDRLAPVATSTPLRCSQLQHCGSVSTRPAGGSSEHCNSVSSHPEGGSGDQWSPARSRGELAFSMRLSPHSSVRTHSFPQGQAFIRKDMQGGWNFTWVPKQRA